MRIGLTQRVEVVEAYGERRDCLDQRWSLLLKESGHLAVPLPNCQQQAEIMVRELALQGLILSGGNDLTGLPGAVNPAPERDAMEKALLNFSFKRRLPVLGVCRGMQFINHYFGGRLLSLAGHVALKHAVKKADDHPLLKKYSEVNSYHNRGLYPDDLGKGLKSALLAADGSIEAFYHRELPWVGIMWHPEREEPFTESDLALLRLLFSGGEVEPR